MFNLAEGIFYLTTHHILGYIYYRTMDVLYPLPDIYSVTSVVHHWLQG